MAAKAVHWLTHGGAVQEQAHLPAEVPIGQAVQPVSAELEVLRSLILINLMLSPAACVFQVPANGYRQLGQLHDKVL